MGDLLIRRHNMMAEAKQQGPVEGYITSTGNYAVNTDIHLTSGCVLEYEGFFDLWAAPSDYIFSRFITTDGSLVNTGRIKKESSNKNLAYHHFNQTYTKCAVASGTYAAKFKVDIPNKTITLIKSDNGTASATWTNRDGLPGSTDYLRIYTRPYSCWKKITLTKNGVEQARLVATLNNGMPCFHDEIGDQYYYHTTSGKAILLPVTPSILGSGIVKNTSNGTVTQNTDGTILLETTSNGWGCMYSPYGDASLFPTYGSVKGKTLIIEVETELNSISGSSSVSITPVLSTNLANNSRVRYAPGKSLTGGWQKFKIPMVDATWAYGSTALADSQRIRYQVYCKSDAGGTLLVKNLFCYFK